MTGERTVKKNFLTKDVEYLDGILIYVFAIVANMAAQVLISVVIGVGGALTRNKDFGMGTYAQLVLMILLQMAFMAVPLIYCGAVKKFKPRLAAPLHPKPSTAINVALPFLTLLGFILPASWFALFLQNIGYHSSMGVELVSVGHYILGGIVMVLIAPFVEELIFRGFLLSGLTKKFGTHLSCLLCGLAFALMHMNPEQTVYQFCLGYVCSLAAIKGKSLLGPMLIHAISNLIAILLDTPVGDYVNRFFDMITYTPWLAAISTVVLAGGCGAAVYFICRAMGKLRDKEDRAAQPTGQETEQPPEPPQAIQCNDVMQPQTVPQDNGIPQPTVGEQPAQPVMVPIIPAKKDNRNMGLGIYFAGMGLCVLMWLFTFVASMLPI